MKVVVVDLSSDMGQALRCMECALATAKLTEKRALELLGLAKASPEILLKARGIYLRAESRVKKIEENLRKMIAKLDPEIARS